MASDNSPGIRRARKAFATNIESLLKDSQLSHNEFAIACGVATGALTAWRSGKRVPNGESLLRIQKKFGVTIDWLLGDAAAPKTRREWRIKGESFRTLLARELRAGAPDDVASLVENAGILVDNVLADARELFIAAEAREWKPSLEWSSTRREARLIRGLRTITDDVREKQKEAHTSGTAKRLARWATSLESIASTLEADALDRLSPTFKASRSRLPRYLVPSSGSDVLTDEDVARAARAATRRGFISTLGGAS